MSLIDLIFPKDCLECKKSGSYICEDCLSKVGIPKPICPKCGKPSIDGFTHIKCKTKYGIDGLVSLWNYEGVIRKAIIALKYKYASEIVNSLFGYLVTLLQDKKFILDHGFTVVPIPMHWFRENSRGFNQSYELGKLVAKEMDWKFVPNLLVRKKLNTPQVQLSGKERKENIKDVFSLSTNYQLLTTNYILFDDVYTTGSTLKEAAMVLKTCLRKQGKGVEKVWGLTVAR